VERRECGAFGLAAQVGGTAREPTGQEQEHRQDDTAEHAEDCSENDVGHDLSLGIAARRFDKLSDPSLGP
jgi:hypothetical protein